MGFPQATDPTDGWQSQVSCSIPSQGIGAEVIPPVTDLLKLLHHRAANYPSQTAFVFLESGENESARLTYAELAHQAQRIAAHLQEISRPGDRALLLFPPGIDFIPAFFGCLCAGVIAVPCNPPKRNRADERLAAIVVDAQASLVLSSSKVVVEFDDRRSQNPELASLQWVATDILDPDSGGNYHEPEVNPDTLAFLQYTSGSTSNPKGVMVTHANLLHNLYEINGGFDHTSDSVMVTWLPIFHDMGLIYGVLFPVFHAFPSVMMPPAAFLQRPIRWLEAISRYRGTHNAAPNFAYDLCVNTTTPQQRSALSLRTWRVAVNGAEPVREETVRRFAAAFAISGFNAQAMCPSYGLAEATLKVASVPRKHEKKVCWVDSSALAQNRIVVREPGAAGAQSIVSCGHSELNKIALIDPERLVRCPPDTVGEIWVSGKSVAKGYWNRPEATEETFHARIADTGEGPFLRTGDLGFLKDGQCFVTGRLKEMIIIRGYNFYPQDIELTVEKSHKALRPGCAAVFAIELNGQECLAIAQEVERTYLRKLDANEVVTAMRHAVAEKHDLQPHAVVLLKPGSIPKTSSGKLQRGACKALFLEGMLAPIAEWHQKPTLPAVTPISVETTPKSREAIRGWLARQLAGRINSHIEALDEHAPFSSHGLDSVGSVQLTTALENWLGRKLSPTLVYDYPSIDALSSHLAGDRETPTTEDRGKCSPDPGTIAVIGMGCRLPGAEKPETFWDLMRSATDGVRELGFPRFESCNPASGSEDRAHFFGGFLTGVDRFEPQFFGIAPREADKMDPQQRLLLEVTWEALEEAGISPAGLSGSQTGVFVGISTNDYQRLQQGSESAVDPYSGTGNAFSIAANRLSYILDLRGPSLAIDTACSSSLVAVHQACQSLRLGECKLVLAGGVNLILSPELTLTFSRAGMLAADGRCKAFDARADGFVRSEGCGIVVLKRLSDALRDGDNVLAVIRGSAVNQDGRSNGLTAPNGPAQRAVVRKALEDAGLPAARVSYVEAHGTGTALGDPIEINMLKEVLLEGRLPEQLCWIGSVKTNIGHLESAAGIAGLIKVVLALEHRQIPANLHFKELNPEISLAGTPLRIPTTLQPWLAEEPRVAGVSSFGFGGTNAHVIVEEAPGVAASAGGGGAPERPYHLLALSAKSAEALGQLVEAYRSFVGQHPQTAIGDLCFTANAGRTHFDHRLAVVCESLEGLQQQLQKFTDRVPERGVICGKLSKKSTSQVAFLFSGQGAQQPEMGRELYWSEPVFRRALERCAEIVQPWLPTGLLEVIYPGDKSSALLHETAYTQPALFALEYALCALWKSWGIEPAVVLGHSLGEYVAACVAGVFSLEDALKLVAARGRLIQALPREGAMVAVMACPERVAAAIAQCEGEVCVAAVNGPQSVVMSGQRAAVEALDAAFQQEGVRTQALQVSHAFHSPLMEAVLEPFAKVVGEVRFGPPRIDLVSNLYGRLAPEQISTADYWCRHMRAPVQFAAGMQSVRQMGVDCFVEIGPKPVLLGMGRQCLTDGGEVLWLPSLRPGRPDGVQMLESLGQLYVYGAAVDWQGFDRDRRRGRLRLPSYPFQRRRCWFEPATKPRVQEQSWERAKQAAPALSPILQLLTQGESDRIAKELEKRLTPEQSKLLPRVIEEIVRQHQLQMAASTLEGCFYRLCWERKARTSDSSMQVSPGRWLLLAERRSELVQRLAGLLEHQGNRCCVLSTRDAHRLAEEFAPGEPLRGIVHFWSLDEGAEGDGLDVSALQQSCQSTLKLVQQLIGANYPARLWLVTRGAVALDGEPFAPPSVLAQAPLWGLGKVLGLEHPGLWGGLVDLWSESSEAGAAESILAELVDSQGEDQLALRKGERFVARLEPYAPGAASGVEVSLRADAIYLITGGTGALGLRTAQWLGGHGARFLLLTSRRKIQTAQQREVLDELAAAGISVQVLGADVADEGAMAQVFGSLSMPLGGVIHAAGVPGYEALKELGPERLCSVLRPKVEGAWILHELTKELRLDFFVCFSSIASLWGSKGQAHYAAANYFLDALCNYRRRLGLPALSINWGPWAGGGMATPEAQRRLSLAGVQTLQPEEALVALGLLLHDNPPQCAVARIDWSRLGELFEIKGPRQLFDHLHGAGEKESALQLPKPARSSAILQQLQQAPQNERSRLLSTYLQGQVATILGFADPNAVLPQSGFFELGMDSLMAVELKNRLAADLSLSLRSTIAFDFPNVEKLSEFLSEMTLTRRAPSPTLRSASYEVPGIRAEPSTERVETMIAEKMARLEELAKR